MNLESLNPRQLKAVQHGEGPLLVMAGAGSGKTRVITNRIAYLIRERGVAPHQILAITFTNKAAGEMKERVRQMLDSSDSSPWISTFHSFCLRVLRQHISALGYSRDFVIYDTPDQLSVIKQCLKPGRGEDAGFPPQAILNHISGFKNEFLLPDDVRPDEYSYGNQWKAAQIYSRYQDELKKNNALDFDDLLIWAVRLFQDVAEVADHYNERFRFVLVDEFQDTNLPQYYLVRLLCRKHHNVCVVGDDDQSIYRWRGANLENILKFEKDFPDTTLIKLEENYRSTQNILRAAGGVVEQNPNRKPKTLWTRNEEGGPVVYFRAEDEIGEARTVCDRILKLNQEQGLLFQEIAVLYRTNAQSRVLEDTLRRLGIPYQVFGGLKFYARKEIKDILAFLRVALNPDDSVSLKRIINVPPRGIGKTSLEKVETFCQETGISLLEGLRQVGKKRLTSTAAANKIARFVEIVDRFKSMAQTGSSPDLLREVIARTGYGAMLEKEGTPESRSRIENLKELISAVEQAVEKEGRTLREFLDATALVAEIDTLDDTRGILPLMTLHTCKGLEFQAVFIIGMEQGLLPHNSSMSDNAEYEEERRLCYVGFTRAKKMLFVSNARRRRIYGSTFNYRPSEFLNSIPEKILVRESCADGNPFPPSETAPSYAIRSRPEPEISLTEEYGENYSVGSRVLHPIFGKGVVIRKTGNEDDLKVEIFFKPPHGKKKIAVNHAKLIPL
ncbi:MAG: ATP-dependent helicase [Nitrospinaceae bacterium]